MRVISARSWRTIWVLAVLALPPSATAQLITNDTIPEPPPVVDNVEAMVLEGVASHRLLWERDSTTISACSILKAIGDPDALYELIEPLSSLTTVIEKSPSPCVEKGDRTEAFAVVHEVSVSESSARVALRVYLDSGYFTQSYELAGPSLMGQWSVNSMRMAGYVVWH